jgi:hypothetical protein
MQQGPVWQPVEGSVLPRKSDAMPFDSTWFVQLFTIEMLQREMVVRFNLEQDVIEQ